MLFNFSSSLDFQPSIRVEGQELEVVSRTKILGLTISSSLKWNDHVDVITTKARKRIFILRKMMSNGFDVELILDTYAKEIRSVLEYGCVVYQHGLTQELSDKLESVQRLVMYLISKYLNLDLSYMESCILHNIEPHSLRRQNQCETFIRRTIKNPTHADMFIHKVTDRKSSRRFHEYQSTNSRMFFSPLVALTRLGNTLKL